MSEKQSKRISRVDVFMTTCLVWVKDKIKPESDKDRLGLNQEQDKELAGEDLCRNKSHFSLATLRGLFTFAVP